MTLSYFAPKLQFFGSPRSAGPRDSASPLRADDAAASDRAIPWHVADERRLPMTHAHTSADEPLDDDRGRLDRDDASFDDDTLSVEDDEVSLERDVFRLDDDEMTVE